LVIVVCRLPFACLPAVARRAEEGSPIPVVLCGRGDVPYRGTCHAARTVY